jgi:hypothetical protein
MSDLNGIIDAFVAAASDTFGKMAMFSVNVEAAESASESEEIFDYVGIIEFPGEFSGLVALCLD